MTVEDEVVSSKVQRDMILFVEKDASVVLPERAD